jgi:teichuronic acid biosynthesis glycosyltransferase TuaC
VHVLTFTTLYPNSLQPLFAGFVRTRMEAYARKHSAKLTVIAPVPWFPRLPFKTSPRYDLLARIPYLESPSAYSIYSGYSVYHPRYLVTPGIGMRLYSKWMTMGARKTLAKIHSENPIDLIDAHYLYPDGAAAVELGAELGIPVVLSARGTDLNVFPTLAPIRPLIANALQACRALICVSGDLQTKALELGIPPSKCFVIGNGVDTTRFQKGDRNVARIQKNLPQNVPIFLSVGNLVEGKGFHILLDALASMSSSEALLLIAGQGPLGDDLQAQAHRLGLTHRVQFLGGVPNSELPKLYQAADAFVLATAREGWPNVVSEAQACGLPVVATRISGIPEIVHNRSLGILVDERTPQAFQKAMEAALEQPWDRDHIAIVGGSRTWDAVADEVESVFQSILGASI